MSIASIAQLAESINRLPTATILEIVSKDSSWLNHINEANITKEIAMGALSSGEVCKILLKKFGNHKDVVLKMVMNGVGKKACILNGADDVLKNDRKFVMKCILINPYEFAHCNFTDDEQLTLLAIADCNVAFGYASARIRNIRSVALEACQYSFDAVQYVSKELLADKTFLYDLIKVHWDTIAYLPESSLDLFDETDVEFLAKMPEKHYHLLKYLHKMTSSKKFALAFIKSNNIVSVLKYFSAEIKNDDEVVLKAVSCNCWSLRYASRRLKENEYVVITALTGYSDSTARTFVLDMMGDELKKDSKFLVRLHKNGLIPKEYSKLQIHMTITD